MIHKTGIEQVRINNVYLKTFTNMNLSLTHLAHFRPMLHTCRNQSIDYQMILSKWFLYIQDTDLKWLISDV